MIKPLLQNCAQKWACFFFLLTASVSISMSHSKITIKKNRLTVKPTADTVKIIRDDYNPAAHLLDKAVNDDFSYSGVSIRFSISGTQPANNFPVKLNIQNDAAEKAQFYNGAKATDTLTIYIDKNDFDPKGKSKIISKELLIRFKNLTGNPGEAYIKIDGQDEYDQTFRMLFNEDIANVVKPKPAPPVKPKHTNTQPSGKVSIVLADSTVSLPLDTFLANTIKKTTAKVYLTLSQAKGRDTTLKLSVKPALALQDVKISEDGDGTEKTYTISIDSADWNEKQDTTIIKAITLQVQQTAAVKDEQDLIVHLTGTGGGTQTIQLMPFKSKPKNKAKAAAENLVKPGDAEIESTKVGISHYYGTTLNSIDSINVRVKLNWKKYDPKNNNLVFALLDSSLNKHFQIMENPDSITEGEWKKALTNNNMLYVPLHIKTTALNDSLNNVQYIDMVLKGQKHIYAGSQKIKLSIKDQPFWAEAGANFDQLDNIKPNNFYVGVYMFDKDRGKINPFNWFNPKDNNLSFTGGVYESQAQSVSNSTDPVFNYKTGSPIYDTSGHIKSYRHYIDTGIISSTTSIQRIGIFVSPHLRLTTGKTDENGIHVFVSAYLEMLWQRVTTNFNYSKTHNVYIITDTGKTAGNNFNSLPYKIQSLNYDYRSHYIGIGLPLYIKEKAFNLYINGVFGLTNQQFALVYNNVNPSLYRPIISPPSPLYNNLLNFMQPKNGWNAFYLVQYRLNEVAYGITFSGEIRSLFIPGSKPVITLALSKKFDLSALLKPLISPFNQ